LRGPKRAASEPLIAEAVFAADLKAGDGDVGAIEKGNAAEDEEPKGKKVSDTSGAFDRHHAPGARRIRPHSTTRLE